MCLQIFINPMSSHIHNLEIIHSLSNLPSKKHVDIYIASLMYKGNASI
uniref:Uncharacterized protein n=1 Tax=Rhizophora mucronata TaxID=61149 RepID=A0A2P2NLJ0_RHIMU